MKVKVEVNDARQYFWSFDSCNFREDINESLFLDSSFKGWV